MGEYLGAIVTGATENTGTMPFEFVDLAAAEENGGSGRNRTGVDGFAGRCMTTLLPSPNEKSVYLLADLRSDQAGELDIRPHPGDQLQFVGADPFGKLTDVAGAAIRESVQGRQRQLIVERRGQTGLLFQVNVHGVFL